jgi:2-oxoglutarate ferredoxin oxidoreductase subunit alpha
MGEWERYRDFDGDGIPSRTIPGGPGPAYFCRGSGHNERAQYSERPEDYQGMLQRLARKFETARGLVPRPEVEVEKGAAIGLVGYGTTHWALMESRDQLLGEHGLKASYLRLRAYPFTRDVAEFFARHERVYVVEQNRDGQMASLLRLELDAALGAKARSVLHYNGLPIDARSITDEVVRLEGLER